MIRELLSLQSKIRGTLWMWKKSLKKECRGEKSFAPTKFDVNAWNDMQNGACGNTSLHFLHYKQKTENLPEIHKLNLKYRY